MKPRTMWFCFVCKGRRAENPIVGEPSACSTNCERILDQVKEWIQEDTVPEDLPDSVRKLVWRVKRTGVKKEMV